MANSTLYVGNLPYSVTESDLVQAFTSYGASNARIVDGRGFGFVDIDRDAMDAAISEKHGSDMGGRTITVSEAKPRENRDGGSNRFGNGYGGGKSRGQRW